MLNVNGISYFVSFQYKIEKMITLWWKDMAKQKIEFFFFIVEGPWDFSCFSRFGLYFNGGLLRKETN